MLTILLPTVVAALTSMHAHPAAVHGQDAGGRLASALADASAIDWVAANDSTITFGIEHGDAAQRITVNLRTDGAIASFAIVAVDGPAHPLGARGVLSWLGGELRDARAIDHLDVEDDGVISVHTSDGRRLLALPAHATGGNAAVEARWAAEWDRDAPES